MRTLGMEIQLYFHDDGWSFGEITHVDAESYLFKAHFRSDDTDEEDLTFGFPNVLSAQDSPKAVYLNFTIRAM